MNWLTMPGQVLQHNNHKKLLAYSTLNPSIGHECPVCSFLRGYDDQRSAGPTTVRCFSLEHI